MSFTIQQLLPLQYDNAIGIDSSEEMLKITDKEKWKILI